MKIRGSVFPTAILSSVFFLTGCLSDQSNASGPTPAGVWLITSSTHDTTFMNGNETLTETTSRQLVVLEESGDNEFLLHDCAADTAMRTQRLALSQAGNSLYVALSFTDHDAEIPYSESEKISLTLDGEVLKGTVSSYDRNLDGSYDSIQSVYIEGHKVSAAQTLEVLSQEEITGLLGERRNRDYTHSVLGRTCTGIASTSSNGNIRNHLIDTPTTADILQPEPQPDLMIAGDASN